MCSIINSHLHAAASAAVAAAAAAALAAMAADAQYCRTKASYSPLRAQYLPLDVLPLDRFPTANATCRRWTSCCSSCCSLANAASCLRVLQTNAVSVAVRLLLSRCPPTKPLTAMSFFAVVAPVHHDGVGEPAAQGDHTCKQASMCHMSGSIHSAD